MVVCARKNTKGTVIIMEITNIREKIEAAKKKAEKEYNEQQQSDWDDKLEAMHNGEHIELDPEEEAFLIETMRSDFFGTICDETKLKKWDMAVKIAEAIQSRPKAAIEISLVEPVQTKQMASLCMTTPYFAHFDPRETKLISQLFYLSDYSFVSALGKDLNMVFNFNDIWTEEGAHQS
jgi:hypothetical protein